MWCCHSVIRLWQFIMIIVPSSCNDVTSYDQVVTFHRIIVPSLCNAVSSCDKVMTLHRITGPSSCDAVLLCDQVMKFHRITVPSSCDAVLLCDQVMTVHRIIVRSPDKGTKMLQNIRHYAHNNMSSHPRRLESASCILKQHWLKITHCHSVARVTVLCVVIVHLIIRHSNNVTTVLHFSINNSGCYVACTPLKPSNPDRTILWVTEWEGEGVYITTCLLLLL
jgi:hypothetical protein